MENQIEIFTSIDNQTVVQKEGKREVKRNIKCYNLDTIISVGYRVNSKRGTQFRQWATKRLKDYLIEGVAINEKRLAQKNKEIQVLHDGIRILSRTIEDQATNNENHAFLHQFSVGLKLLDDYDHESLDEKGKHTKKAEYPSMVEYMELVEKNGGFDSAVNQIRQGFGEQDAYPSIEEKAAMLLYLVIKNSHYQQRSSCQPTLICGSISEQIYLKAMVPKRHPYDYHRFDFYNCLFRHLQ